MERFVAWWVGLKITKTISQDNRLPNLHLKLGYLEYSDNHSNMTIHSHEY
jgi:hypothetical protein